jgi:protein TonB
VRIEPQYPREALLKGIQGWVRVRFTIMEDGSVDDPIVVESEPRRLFDRAAIRAILRWKFKPRIVDGKAVRREAEQVIDFKLDNA